MNDQVELVKSKIDIVEVIGERVVLKKAGRHFKGLCPFHSEKSPSFIVSSERQSFKCFGCFPAGSLIKSNGGLVPIEKVVEGDEIISGSGALRKVTRLLIRDYEGLLRHIKLKKLSGDVILTTDHKVLVVRGTPYTRIYKNFSKRYKKYLLYNQEKYFDLTEKYFPVTKITAGEIQLGDLLLYPIVEEVVDPIEIDLQRYVGINKRGLVPREIPLRVNLNEDFLKLVGYYIAEGSNNRAYIRFSLGANEHDFAQEIVQLVKSIFGLEASLYFCKGDKSGIEVTCCNAQLARMFENLCGKGAENKHIPYELNLISPARQRVLLEAIWKGDGTDFVASQSINTHRSVTTISRELLVQLRDVLLRLGIHPTEYKLDERLDKNEVHHRDSYTIYWSEGGHSKYDLVYKTRKGARYWLLPIHTISESYFKDKVYNLTVDVDHSYVSENFAVGNCQEGGDVLTFLQKYDGMSFLESLELLAKRVGITLESYRPTSQDAYRKRLLEIASLASEYYHYLLTKHASGSEAREYLKARGIGSEAITQFNLGYAPNQWRSVSDFLIQKKKYTAEEVEAVGLVIRKDATSYYDRFRGRVIFPLKDHKGVVVGFSGRTLLKDEKEAKYINSPETSLYSKSKMLYGLWENREYIRKENGIVLVEGELDMIPSWQAGVKNVAAIKGSAFTNEQAQLIARFTKNVAMSLDSDSAGQEAIKRAVIIAENMDLSIRVVQIKGGKDPGDVATANGRSWREMVSSAVLYWDFLIDSALSQHDPKTGDGARIISNEVVPALALIANSVMRAHYVSELAKKLSVPEDSIYAEINRSNKKKELNILKQTVSSIEKGQVSRREEVEEYLLALTLQFFDKVKVLLPKIELTWISMPAVAKIFDKLALWEEKKEFKIQTLVAEIPPELQPVLDTTYLKDLSRVEDPVKEWERTVMEMRGLYGRAELKKLASEIAEAEKKGEMTETLQARFVTLSKSLSGIM